MKVLGRLPRRSLMGGLVLASLGFVSLGLPEGMLGVAWPSIRATFGLPLDALGLLLATFATGYFVSSAASGWLIGRISIGSALAASCGLTGAALLGYSLSPTWLSMVGLGAILGLGAGTIDAGLNTYAAIAHGPRALNWMHAAFGVGAAVGPLVMTAILSSGLTWNVGYVIVGVAQLGLAASYWLTRERYVGPPPDRREVSSDPDQSSSTRALLRHPLAWISVVLFFVYVGVEAAAGQWSFSLFTLSRGTPTTVAGLLISAYWASLTIGRVLFGFAVTRISGESLLRVCMVAAIAATTLIWLDLPVVSWLALAVLGLVLAPIFPVLIAETPSRLGSGQTANAIGFQVAAAVVGGASIPASIGILAARTSLEAIGPCLLGAAVVQFVLHEVLTRSASRGPLKIAGPLWGWSRRKTV